MKDFFKKTKMMEEAKSQGKKFAPVIETLIFLAVFYVGNFAQSIFIVPATVFYLYSDPLIINILSSETPDVNAFTERVLELSASKPEWILVLSLFSTACIIAAVIVYCKFIEKRTLASVGIRKHRAFSEYIAGFLLGCLLMSAAIVFAVLTGTIKFEGLGSISAVMLVLYFVAYLIQGMSEELLIRGYFMTALGKTANSVYVIVCSSLFFALMHFGNNGISLMGIINLFLFGLVAGVYVLKRGNIWGVAALHSAWNFVQGTVFGFPVGGSSETVSLLKFSTVDGFERLNGGTFGPEGGLWVTLVLFVALGLVLALKQNKNEIAEMENNEENN